jgi:hypothetical protein
LPKLPRILRHPGQTGKRATGNAKMHMHGCGVYQEFEPWAVSEGLTEV